MEPCPAPAGRPRFDIADIVRQHRSVLEAETHLTLAQRRVLSAMALCRTAALGGHVDVCRSCGFERPAYNSCRNRHCPKCQALRQERWIAARTERLLSVRHFHVVFTLPSELRALGQCYPRELFGTLFAAASETLLELGESRLRARLGVTMVLHTWTRELRFHPHVHALVTAGGFATDGSSWVSSGRKYLFPVQVMGILLRGKMMGKLRSLHASGRFANFGAFADPEAFDVLMARLAKKSWIVYAKKPFREVDHVLKYLGRYTHRVGISNSRLVDVQDEAITFRTKNGKTVTVAPVEFLQRFVQHVLPDGFQKIRHFGLYAGASEDMRLAAHQHLAPPVSPPNVSVTCEPAWSEQLRELTGHDIEHCPLCGGQIEHRPVARPTCRAPPRTSESESAA
ncbi:MAG TPA: IS91 family transposase [Opitutaceae bacterium]|nr:IS91 family transposase [Opitutaceae bacterium]